MLDIDCPSFYLMTAGICFKSFAILEVAGNFGGSDLVTPVVVSIIYCAVAFALKRIVKQNSSTAQLLLLTLHDQSAPAISHIFNTQAV